MPESTYAVVFTLPGSSRNLARQMFREAIAGKLTPENVCLDVRLKCQFALFTPGHYRNLPAYKRLLDCLQADPDAATEYARQLLTRGGHA